MKPNIYETVTARILADLERRGQGHTVLFYLPVYCDGRTGPPGAGQRVF